MDYSNEICIVCEKSLVDCGSDARFPSNETEDELRDLGIFMRKTLSIPPRCFEYSGFPVCKVCTNSRIKELLRIHNEILALQISFKSLKEILQREIVTVYFNRSTNWDRLNSEGNWLTEAVIKKWEDYSSNPLLSSADKIKCEADEFICPPPEVVMKEENELGVDENSKHFSAHDNNPEMESQSSQLSSSRSRLKNKLADDNSSEICDDITNNSDIKISPKIKYGKIHVSYGEYSKAPLSIFKDSDEEEEDVSNESHSDKTNDEEVFLSDSDYEPAGGKKKKTNEKKSIPKFLKCQICSKELKGKYCLEVHMRGHMNARPYTCSECNQTFRQTSSLYSHQRLRHGFVGKSKTAEGLNQIAAKHRTYYCGFCPEKRKYKALLIRHLINDHIPTEINEGGSIWYYYCDAKDCSVSCVNQDRLKKHFVESHQNLLRSDCSEFPSCDICQRGFVLQENLDLHRNCHLSSNSKNKNRLKFSCEYCWEVFRTEREQKEHKPRHQVICNTSEFFGIICDLCGDGFRHKKAMYQHKKTHVNSFSHGKLPSNGSKRKKGNKNLWRNYECRICLSWYSNKSGFIRHLKSSHVDKGAKDGDIFWFYYCDVKECLASCTSVERLSRHYENSHRSLIKGKNFPQCNVCQREFVLQENLERHKILHSDVSSYKSKLICDYCPDAFSSVSELSEHQSVHKIIFDLSEFCHLCDWCGEGFRDLSALHYHKNYVHRTQDKIIIRCDSPEPLIRVSSTKKTYGPATGKNLKELKN